MQASFSSVKVGALSEGSRFLTHPLGLAAGFDKSAKALNGWGDLGFSFLEIGTVTPKPQTGNPKPRIFRFPEQRALINRMGFNNEGFVTVRARLAAYKQRASALPVGVNIGKNAATPLERAVDDYLAGFTVFKDLADYLVFNISSPNTAGLRSLAQTPFLSDLGKGIGAEERRKCWIKLDPDSDRQSFERNIEQISMLGFYGVILTNTHAVKEPQQGGLSGHPLAVASTQRLEWAFGVHHGKLKMMASGGVLSGLDVLEKLARGAHLVQLYTALIYRGPLAVQAILRELHSELQLRGFATAEEAIGSFYV